MAKEIKQTVNIPYSYSYGHFVSRFFLEMKHNKKLWGTKCPECKGVMLPPQAFCGRCFVDAGEWVEVKDTGKLKGFGVVHIPFLGQIMEPPYVYAELTLDGSNTTMIHILGEVNIDRVFEEVRVGMPVQAVWKEDGRQGNLQDILYFKPLHQEQE